MSIASLINIKAMKPYRVSLDSMLYYESREFCKLTTYFLFDLIATWEYVGEWSECSATCGGGTQTGTQSCVNSDNIEAKGECSGVPVSKSQDCNDNPCRK